MLTTRYHLDEAHLSYYDEKLKSWASSQPVKTLPSSLYPWTQTDKAGAVTCWPAGGTELRPVVDFLFTETPPASGDKGPENPSSITGVSSVKVTRCGKNILPPYADTTRGIWTVNSDGTVTANATNLASETYFTIKNLADGNVLYPGTYVMSGCTGGSSSTYQFNLATKKANGSVTYRLCTTQPVVFTLTETEQYSCNLHVAAGVTLDYTFKPQLEIATSATSYEQIDRNVYTIDLGNTYYGGALDVASGVMTVTWEKLAVTGSEAWQSLGEQATGIYSYALVRNFNSDGGATGNGDTCSHFVYNNGASEKIVSWHHSKKYIYVYSSISALSDFKAWLASQSAAGTPVEFCFQSNEATTVQLSPTQILSLAQTDKYTPRLNTVYTDANAVQVGYVKSPTREEYELTQAIVAQGGNV